jgi:Carboxypeptidase regulatory-like domain
MKNKLLLLALSLFTFVIAKANGGPDPDSGTTSVKGKKNDITGVVVSSADNKKPLSEVNVTAYLVSKKEKVIQTDESGIYAFDDLKPGTYKFVFEKTGFKKVTKEKVVIKTDESFQLNIEMIESRNFDLVPSPLHFTDF